MKILDEKGNLVRIEVHQTEPVLYCRGHLNVGKAKIIHLHRLQAINVLEKSLPKEVKVHHSEGTLIICQDEKYHKLLHTREQAYKATGDPHKRKCNFCKNFDDISNLQVTSSYYYHKECHNIHKRKWRQSRREQGLPIT